MAEKVDISAILWFFETDLGKLLLEHSTKVKREQPFAMLMTAEEVFENYPDETDELLIHGIVDGYIEFADDIYLYDFKTDFLINPDDPTEIDKVVQKYLGQLRLYQQALADSLGKPVTNTFLVLLRGKKIINVNKRL